jgi:hypothetical protein
MHFFICTPICTKFYSCKKWVLHLTTGDIAAFDTKVASSAESDTTPVSSPSNTATCMIVKKDIPTLQDYLEKSTVTEADLAAYHATSLLSGGVISSTSDLEFRTVDQTIIIYFEYHLITSSKQVSHFDLELPQV